MMPSTNVLGNPNFIRGKRIMPYAKAHTIHDIGNLLATLPGACSHQGVFPIPFYTMHSSTVKEKNLIWSAALAYSRFLDNGSFA